MSGAFNSQKFSRSEVLIWFLCIFMQISIFVKIWAEKKKKYLQNKWCINSNYWTDYTLRCSTCLLFPLSDKHKCVPFRSHSWSGAAWFASNILWHSHSCHYCMKKTKHWEKSSLYCIQAKLVSASSPGHADDSRNCYIYSGAPLPPACNSVRTEYLSR